MNEKHLVVLECVALLVEISSVVGYCCIFFFFFGLRYHMGARRRERIAFLRKVEARTGEVSWDSYFFQSVAS